VQIATVYESESTMKLTASHIARMIDHSILHPTFTDADLKTQCAIAVKFSVTTVCVKPYHVAMASALVAGSAVKVCAVIGFPHGNSTLAIKLAETQQVIDDGATEVDMVVNPGHTLQHDWVAVKTEMHALNQCCVTQGAILKVIFENDFLPDNALRIKLCEIANECDVAFVKTSTGYGFVKVASGDYNYAGATVGDVTLMRAHCKPSIEIKAAGGVRNLDQILAMRAAGATRVGATATEQILEEAHARFGA
jgi:deoxyribose-phosphate aldolase